MKKIIRGVVVFYSFYFAATFSKCTSKSNTAKINTKITRSDSAKINKNTQLRGPSAGENKNNNHHDASGHTGQAVAITNSVAKSSPLECRIIVIFG